MSVTHKLCCVALLFAALAFATVPAIAQERRPPEEGGEIYSLGLPGRTLLHGGITAGAYRPEEDRQFIAYGSLAGYRDLIHRAYTIIGLWGEGYVGYRDVNEGDVDAGLRAMIMAPAFKIGAGIDYNLYDKESDAIFSLMLPLRRGGILGHGSMFRLDWLPTRGNTFSVGIEVAMQRYAGKTRPPKDHVKFKKPKVRYTAYEVTDTTLDISLANIKEAAHWINRLTVPYLDHKGFKEKNGLKDFREEMQIMKTHMASTGSLYPKGRTIHEEVRVYHEELDRVFSIAASGGSFGPGESSELGRAVSVGAREVLFEEIILRYDRLLGQRKKNDSILNIGANARGIFSRWVNTESGVTDEDKDEVLYVFEKLIEIIEENRKWSRDRWNDPRLVWLPMQLALHPDQHDTQAEMDRLIERATRHEFTDGNQVYYLINEQFQFEVGKMIRAAEDYHVLWIHDFRGVDAAGEPDEVSFGQVIDSYYAAMTQRVRDYDDTGKFPVYMIVQDQFYYENNKARRWHELLMNPMEHKMDFPKAYKWMETMLDSAQAELRDAVANSQLLQAEAREYGDEWLKDRIKVHVSITQPADASYWSLYVLPVLGLHDCYIRDHRKISFYDITEEDPYKGGAIYTGMGIGEHYIGATWEDRGIMAKGPALLDLRESCVQLMLRNGFEEDEIPHVLRPKQKPANYDEMVAVGPPVGKPARAMELHNVVGFGPKRISVFKAMIYTLMPPGSVLLMPDFVWQNPLWGSMAVGGALRGTRSLIVYPSLPNQPSPSGIPQSRARELFRRLVEVQHEFEDEFTASGGLLKTGFYDLPLDVKDIRGRVKMAAESFQKNPFLLELIHTDKALVETAVDRLLAALDREGFEVHHYVEDAKVRHPQLHLKAQFYASSEAWDNFFRLRDAGGFATSYVVAWAKQLRDGRSEPTQFQMEMAPYVEKFRKAAQENITEEEWEKAMVYLSVGSQNMDFRGMFLDGEVSFIASRGGVLTGFYDLLHVIEVSDWVDSLDEVDKHMGTYGAVTRHLARWATPLM